MEIKRHKKLKKKYNPPKKVTQMTNMEDINDKKTYFKRGKNIRVNKRYLTDFKNKKNLNLYSKDKEVLIINKKKIHYIRIIT